MPPVPVIRNGQSSSRVYFFFARLRVLLLAFFFVDFLFALRFFAMSLSSPSSRLEETATAKHINATTQLADYYSKDFRIY